ncbi:MAG: hypothetical protein ACKPKO_65255, partial [Candidatus Fonsibacter sp.]
MLTKLQPFFVTYSSSASSAAAPSHVAHISDIAMTCNAHPTNLIYHKEQHKPIVVSEKRKGPTLMLIGAWSKALERTLSTFKRRQTYLADSLRPMFAVLRSDDRIHQWHRAERRQCQAQLGSAKRNLGEQWQGSEFCLRNADWSLQTERQHATPH